MPSEKRFKDRFKKTDNWTTINRYGGLDFGQTPLTTVLGRLQRKYDGSGNRNITSITAYGSTYGVDVVFNKQSLVLQLDTGSSDTWAVSASSNCTPWHGDCSFGTAYTGGFTGGLISNEHLYIQYGGGEVVQGPVGAMDVTVAGISVRNQTVALANDTLWDGNNITSGVLGLAYPSITSVFTGPFGDHSSYYGVEYAPIFTTMVDQGLVENYFSVAISRHASGGALAFGGVPDDLDGVDYSSMGMTDIIIANIGNDETTAYEYSFYTIIPGGWIFGSSTDNRKIPYIVDSGTTLIYLPLDLADAINNAFEPPAEYDFLYGSYLTTCDAAPPRLAIVIDNTPFWLHPEDLILRDSQDPLSGLCMTAIATSEDGPFILGDAFLKNVLAVFDVDDAVMQFASRRNY
ncbi:acid protease [Cryphonectria parasitica EP155]|uniref:Acid protease n=1 Tax=Cryphonectria parasitica (strain ATCC 38755 / EP155) TaxID=660469 RepID=A0A9P4Y273_CRYP1|nr:acid protease [Cryphonectria parasitica EP155]KAF3765622.1 acid protease [Cryphonectria parasitica EP155]